MVNLLVDGKTKGTLEPYTVPSTDGYVASADHQSLHLSDKTAKRCLFFDIALKEVEIQNCDFSYSIFVGCYFRGAKLKSVNFTGCQFLDCNFRGASLINCTLSYSKWRETHISKDTILANLPAYPNVAQELLINMRINATSVGEYGDARSYLYRSEALSRSHLKKIITCDSEYYKKYDVGDRMAACIKLARSYIERFFWGYGEKPGTLVASAVAIITVFALYYWPREANGFIDAEKLSAQVFVGNVFTLSIFAKSPLTSWAMTFESLFGIVFIGFLAASLHRRISTRKE